VGLDGRTISSSAYPGGSSGGTNNGGHLILTSSKQFQSAAVPGGRNSNSPPSAIPARCVQARNLKMRTFSIILLTLCFGCQSRPNAVDTIPTVQTKIISRQDFFKISYDIPLLKSYTDTSKYIAIFMITKRYNNFIAIEFTEMPNGVNLCVKQPTVDVDFNNFDSLKSLPFNQLCYWFNDSEAARIKDGFRTYETDKIVRDISCEGCLDPETWTLEIYNHGHYSSVTKDAYGEYEPFIDTLFTKVNMGKKKGYYIKQ